MSTDPRATLRLQIHAGYTLDDAADDLPYFEQLGVSHLYLSPISRARPGSTHGYDVVDHGTVDPERGGEAGLRRLAAGAKRKGMGLLLDIVPNHMATAPENAWWWDVLKHGRDSTRATWFDIQWDASAVPGRVLAPFLGKPFDQALLEGEIALKYDDERGFHISAGGVPYPLADRRGLDPRNVAAVLAMHDPACAQGCVRLRKLLETQHYRLAHWRSAAQIINWRRFFEESGLIGVRVECEEVFDAVHELPLRLYAEGLIDGLRIDHVDGLARPLEYCARLRAAMVRAAAARPDADTIGEPWIVVEKILAPGEQLDERWAVSGTTGYDFAADVAALMHDAAGEDVLFQGWTQIAADDRPAHAWLVEARRTLLERNFGAERNALLNTLMRLAAQSGQPGWSRGAMARALDALLWHYPTYRSYVEAGPRQGADQRWFDMARQAAARGAGPDGSTPGVTEVQAELLEQLDTWLGGSPAASCDGRQAIRRFQQLTPPLAAKSLEDTVFYRYGCLLSRNEVGSHPERFASSVQAFHESNVARARRMPRGLLATATHDHKRGEDVRARLAVLSERPEEWLDECRAWLTTLSGGLPEAGPKLAFHYMLMQTIVGAWPPDLSADDGAAVQGYLERVAAWAVKAMREGKQLSSWTDPNATAEQAMQTLLLSLAPGGPGHAVLQDIERYVRRIEPAAIANGLIQTALRLTCPGVPDIYQGTEYRDFSLVDPDNRRPVDYATRFRSLNEGLETGQPGAVRHVLAEGAWPAAAWPDGRTKQALIARLLELRRECAAAFEGDYRPLPVTGDAATRVLAFSRAEQVVVVAGVKCAAALHAGADGTPVADGSLWGDAEVSLPAAEGGWHDVLRGCDIGHPGGQVKVAGLLAGFPLAVLRRNQG